MSKDDNNIALREIIQHISRQNMLSPVEEAQLREGSREAGQAYMAHVKTKLDNPTESSL